MKTLMCDARSFGEAFHVGAAVVLSDQHKVGRSKRASPIRTASWIFWNGVLRIEEAKEVTPQRPQRLSPRTSSLMQAARKTSYAAGGSLTRQPRSSSSPTRGLRRSREGRSCYGTARGRPISQSETLRESFATSFRARSRNSISGQFWWATRLTPTKLLELDRSLERAWPRQLCESARTLRLPSE